VDISQQILDSLAIRISASPWHNLCVYSRILHESTIFIDPRGNWLNN